MSAVIDTNALASRVVAERWLQDEVVPVYNAMQTDPARGIPAKQVMAALRARHADRLKKADP